MTEALTEKALTDMVKFQEELYKRLISLEQVVKQVEPLEKEVGQLRARIEVMDSGRRGRKPN